MAVFLYTFFGKMDESVEENEGVAIFLYTFLEKTDESVEENEGVAIFLYIFLEKMDKSVEENKGVAIFLPFFDENVLFTVEENAGVAVFLYTFQEKGVFGVEENRGVTIFLPFFDENVLFAVEENAGVPVFLYTFAQNYRRTTAKRSWPAASGQIRCGVGLRPTDWTEAEAPFQRCPLQERFLMEQNSKKSGLARLPIIFVKKEGRLAAALLYNMESFFHLRWPSRHFSRGQGASSDFASLAAVFCGQIMPFPQRLS